MLIVDGAIVLCNPKNSFELLADTQAAIATFVTLSKDNDVPDEIIEKSLVSMIDIAFRHQDDIFNGHFNKKDFEKQDLDDILKSLLKDAKDKGLL